VRVLGGPPLSRKKVEMGLAAQAGTFLDLAVEDAAKRACGRQHPSRSRRG